MRRTPSVSTFARPLGLAGFVFLLLALVVSAAEARIGIPRKVKDTVTKSADKKTTPQASEEPVVFDDVTLELTEARLAEIMSICERIQKLSSGRPGLVAEVDKANEERSKFREKNDPKMQALRDKRSEIEACRHDAFSEIRDRKTKDYSERALTDPALREKYQKAAMQYNAAAAQGDSVAIQKLNEVMYSEILPSKEDSAGVDRKCGTVPSTSPEEKKLEALDKAVADAQQKVADLDAKIATEVASTKGSMTRGQWAMAVERIQMYLAKKANSKGDPAGYSDEEIKALDQSLDDLKKANCWN